MFFKQKNFVVIVCLLLWILLFVGCINIPCELTSDLKKVNLKLSNREVIGLYKFEEKSLNYAIGDIGLSSELVLKLNGKLQINDFPTKVFTHESYDVESYKQTSAEGTWEISDYKNQKVITLDIKFDRKFNQIRDKTQWKIYTKDNKILLYYIFGDIDACSVARLLKIE